MGRENEYEMICERWNRSSWKSKQNSSEFVSLNSTQLDLIILITNSQSKTTKMRLISVLGLFFSLLLSVVVVPVSSDYYDVWPNFECADEPITSIALIKDGCNLLGEKYVKINCFPGNNSYNYFDYNFTDSTCQYPNIPVPLNLPTSTCLADKKADKALSIRFQCSSSAPTSYSLSLLVAMIGLSFVVDA